MSFQKQPKDDSEANGSEPSTLSSPVSGVGHHGEPASRETTDTEAAGQCCADVCFTHACPLNVISSILHL